MRQFSVVDSNAGVGHLCRVSRNGVACMCDRDVSATVNVGSIGYTTLMFNSLPGHLGRETDSVINTKGSTKWGLIGRRSAG